jgi:hypothetical protein
MRPGFTIAIGIGILLTGWLLTPNLHGRYRRQHLNEASTVGWIRTINIVQVTYASKNSRFTCRLSELDAVAEKDRRIVFHQNGEYVGYRFSLQSCDPDPNHPRYQVIAVPKEPGVTGFKAFCSDESGAIYFDPGGSGEDCLRRKRRLD